MLARLTFLLCTWLLVGCGGGTSSSETIGRTSRVENDPTLSLSLTGLDRAQFDVADLRGRRVLLFLFATFDLTSQAAIEPLQEFARQHPEILVIGVAVQPDPHELLTIFSEALQIEFDLTYDADNMILRGLSELGQINAVPSYILIEASGVVAKKSSRPMSTAALTEWFHGP